MRRAPTKVSSIVYIVAGLMALMMGIVVLMVPALFGEGDAMRYAFAAMFFLYGGYRLWTGLSQIKRQDENPTI